VPIATVLSSTRLVNATVNCATGLPVAQTRS
jgi:hypothetical protein